MSNIVLPGCPARSYYCVMFVMSEVDEEAPRDEASKKGA